MQAALSTWGDEASLSTSTRQWVIPSTVRNNTVNVTGLLDGVQIATYTADGYTTLEYSYVTGSDFQLEVWCVGN